MILEKIKEDIVERSLRKNFKLFPTAGKSEHEFSHRYCKSDMEGLQDYYFVVSKILKYKGNSIDDYGYVVYVYDKEGNFVEDPEINSKCRGQFFDSIKDIT